jgi:DNA-binding GntR family transcriptional regulator
MDAEMTVSSTVNKVDASSGTRVDGLRRGIQTMILGGEMAPGERMNEVALAQRFGVSRGPIREAIRALEQERLISVIPNRGAVVRRIDLAEVLELYDVRAGLARSAGRLLAARATPNQISTLRALQDRMQTAVAANSVIDFQSANFEFHEAILEFAGNKRLRELDRGVANELQLCIRYGSRGSAQLRASLGEHESFLEALVVGDTRASADALEHHVLNGRQRMLENITRV